MVSQLFVGREKSIAALDEAMARDKEIFLAAQKNAKTNESTPDDIFQVGTLGTVMQLLRLPDGTVKVLVEGKRRAKTKRFVQTDEFFLVEVDEIAESGNMGVEVMALMRSVQAAFEMYVKLNKKVQPEVLMSVQTIDDLRTTVVAVHDRVPVLIGDIADVREAPAVRRGVAHRLAGEVVSCRVVKQFGADTVTVAAAVRAAAQGPE